MRLSRSIVAVALCTACARAIGFSGGGLDPKIKTVAILPFDNRTADPGLSQQVNLAIREALQSRLGLRSAGEASADAIVRGTITRYEPDQPVQYSGTGTVNGRNQVQVTQRIVQLSLDVEIKERESGRTLFERKGMALEGQYDPGREADGRRRALEKLVTNIVEGAQSQW